MKINYEQYFTQCASNICTYSYSKHADLVYMITFILGAYGGLQTALRMLIPCVLRLIMKKKQRNIINDVPAIRAANLNWTGIAYLLLVPFHFGSSATSRKNKRAIDSCRPYLQTDTHWAELVQIIWSFSWSSSSSPTINKTLPFIAFRWAGVSILLLAGDSYFIFTGSIVILMLFVALDEQTTTITYHSPSYDTYQELQTKYSVSLYCSCSEIKQPHSAFLTLIPKLHPVCTSAFVEDIWLRQLIFNIPYNGIIYSVDWRYISNGLFQTLAALCDLASNTINDTLLRFNLRSFVSSRLLDENSLISEINDIFTEFIRNVENELRRTTEIFRLLNQVDQYFSATISNGIIEVTNETIDGHVEVWVDDKQSSYWNVLCVTSHIFFFRLTLFFLVYLNYSLIKMDVTALFTTTVRYQQLSRKQTSYRRCQALSCVAQ